MLQLGEVAIGVLVADVSGHGLGPALLMAQTQAYLRALAENCADPGELVAGANRLFATSDSGHFVTMFLGRLDVATRSFSYVAAGHQGYLIAHDGAVRVLRSHCIPLGVQKKMLPCPASKITLETADILVVPTDEAEEAMSVDGRRFGRDRIFDLVRNNKDKPAVDIVEALFQAARDFADHRSQEDDITAVVVKVLPSASTRTSDPSDRCGSTND